MNLFPISKTVVRVIAKYANQSFETPRIHGANSYQVSFFSALFFPLADAGYVIA